MVDKISVNPLSVRGAGDIVSPKTSTDFDVYNSTITSNSEEVDGATMTVYTVSYVNGTYFKISSDNIIPVGETSFTVSAVLRQSSDDSAVSGATVTCLMNNETELTGTTDTGGNVSFTFDMVEDVGKYIVKLMYKGSGGNGGAFKVTGLLCVDLTTLLLGLTGDKTIIQTGDDLTLTATLTGTDSTGATIGLPHQRVYFTRDNQTPLGYENDGTDLSTLTIGSGVNCTISNGALRITTSITGEKYVSYNCDLNSSDNFIFECEMAKEGVEQPIAMYVKNATTATGCWFAYNRTLQAWGGGCMGETFNNEDCGLLAPGDIIRIKYENQVITLYHNDDVIFTKTAVDFGDGFRIGHYTNQNRVQYVKNISITPEGVVGKGVTDANGVATTVYNGTGAGKLDLFSIYPYNNTTITTPYQIIDGLFYDPGILGTKNNNWQSLRLTSLTDDEGTSLTATGDYAHYLVKSSSARFSVDFSIEFQTLTCTQSALNFLDSSTNVDRKEYLKPDTYYKFTITSTGYEVYENGTYTKKVDLTFASVRVSLYLPNASSSVLKYNSFVLYAYDPKRYIILSLTGDKSIIQTGEDVTFTAEAINGLGEPVPSLNVDFVDEGSGAVIATGVTDSDGVVNGVYTGTGTGEVEFVAYNKERTVSSEIYEVMDAKHYDRAIQSKHNDSMWNMSSATFTRLDDYSSLTNGTLWLLNLTDDCTVDFGIMQVDSNVGAGLFNVYATGGLTYFALQHLGLTNSVIGTWLKLRLRIVDGNATLSLIDDPTKSRTNALSEAPTRLRFLINNFTELRFRNIRIY